MEETEQQAKKSLTHNQQQVTRKWWNTRHNQLRILVILAILLVIVGSFLLLWFWVLSPRSIKDNAEIPLASSNSSSSTPTVVLAESLAPTTSIAPTQLPSHTPTTIPSISPTTEYFPPHPIPDNPPKSYFNYNILDETYGPNAWKRIDMSGTYWSEFGDKGFGPWESHMSRSISDITKNRCGQVAKQSPVFLTPSTNVISCTASHQIRHRPGRLPLSSGLIQKRFESNALRIQLNRRPCLPFDKAECKTNRPPIADFPNYSSQTTHFSDLMHMDIKVKGEHQWDGVAPYDAELQFMHIHQTDPRSAYIAVPIRAEEGADVHEAFQELLDEFQVVYDQHRFECERSRNLRSAVPPTRRRVQQTQFFDPYTAFLPTVYFYRYNGSSPDPPCVPVTWFALLEPIVISTSQLRQLKRLLFTHVDETCRPTSVHNAEQTVTRPIQELGILEDTGEARTLMYCQEGDFSPDVPEM